MLRFQQIKTALGVCLTFYVLTKYTCDATTDCDAQLTEQAGVILSPGFPYSYPNNADCHWTITVEENQIIILRFQRIDLERYSSSYCRDYLIIYDGPSRASPQIGNYVCGYRTEEAATNLQFRSSNHQLHLYFYSDSTETRTGFSASYLAHECPPFMYGQDACDTPCTCDQENSLYCVSTSGACVCKDGWVSANCTEDINECEDPNLCFDLYSECNNLLGSFECICRPGLSKNATGSCEDPQNCTAKTCSHACGVTSTSPHTEECYCPRGMYLDPNDNLTCVACPDGKFGFDCVNKCTCIESRTQSCDKRNGLCTCYLNWTSTDCREDVNECGLENPPCNNSVSSCSNTFGSFECRCFQGFEKVASEITCEECGRVLTQKHGVIESPMVYTYHGTRSDFQECNWTIETDEGNVISLRFQRFGLYYSRYSNPGYIEVYDGRNSSTELIGNYSGASYRYFPPEEIIRSSGHQMYIARYAAVYYGSARPTSGFDATYWTHECQDFMYGDNCTLPCTCNRNNTDYCNSTNAHCVCKEGWRSDDCSEDIDECFENPLQCPDYSSCKNLNGSFECTCKPGLNMDSDGNCTEANDAGHICTEKSCSHLCGKITPDGETSATEQCYCPIGMELDGDNCVACRNMTYGPDCYRDCNCVSSNTDTCDARTGNCTCLQGWTADDCSNDIDECCSHIMRNASETIMSPNYPSDYFNNAFCTWNITVDEGNVISLRFAYFYIRISHKCAQDYLEVYDGDSTASRLIGKYCHVGVPEIIRTTGNKMYILFVSDWRYIYGGFLGTYTSHSCEVDMYGRDSCNNSCTCVKENTQLCDNVNGQCICKQGWRSSDCSVDVNECQGLNDCPENSDCANTLGGYRCDCHPGYVFNVSTSQCNEKSECTIKTCSHACYVNELQQEQCACPEDLVLNEIDGFCYVPFYPFGPAARDETVLSYGSASSTFMGGPIHFSSGVPFGNSGESRAFVLSKGVIGFGGQQMRLAGSADLVFAFRRHQKIVAPFWADISPSAGLIYYHLYEKCGCSVFSDDKVSETPSPKRDKVMERAEKDVMEFYNLPGFEVNTVLVATWESVQPLVSYSVIPEENSFQAIYVSGWTRETRKGVEFLSDTETAYVIFIYQYGFMKWNFVSGRPISIGIAADDIKSLNDLDTNLITMLDRLSGNTGYSGVISFQVGRLEGPEQKCHKYLCNHADLLTDSVYEYEVTQLYKCPCTLERLGRQWRLYEKRGVNRDIYCYAISFVAKRRLLQDNKRNKLCCYRWNKPDNDDWRVWLQTWRAASYLPASPESGHVLISDPWSLSYNYQALENMRAHKWCCQDSEKVKYCERFYKIFPDMGCSNFVTFVPASALGDPHITTLDGVKYTMNGWGEYIMLDIPSANFTLQARTGRAETSNGTLTNATVFIGFAVKESDSTSFQVELAFSKKSMIILANGADLTNDFNGDVDYRSPASEEIDVLREYSNNKTYVVAVFPCGVSIKVHVAVKSLEIEFEVEKELEGKTRGLLGNFNNRTDDEFILPNGTQLNSDLSEREIYERFAKKWEVTSANSVFSYESGEGTEDYQHPDFVPFFRDEEDNTSLTEAIKLCGDRNDACIFDYLVTQDQQFADSTKQSQEELDSVTTNLQNNPPSISVKNNSLNSNNRLVVNTGTVTTVEVIAVDDDGDSVAYELIGSPVGVSVNDKGQITLTAHSNRPVTLGVRAQDSKGSYSPIEYIPIAACTGCNGKGQCDDNATREVEYEDGRFQLFVCNCHPAYTGDDCESELDACSSEPCSKGQECTDLTASEQGDSPVGYECGPCPPGFFDVNGTCGDINECSDSNQCEHICTNTEGSYVCSCRAGYRLEMADSKSCSDINECEERLASCQQVCVNTEGNYTCDCRDSYNLNADGLTCTLDPANATACEACRQICTNTGCDCNIGYQIDPANSSSCIDIDECNEGNSPCSQVCINLYGKFKCSCYTGYQLDDDGVSCSACERPYYGEDCTGVCQCNGRGRCDPVRGCLCNEQWTGPGCEVDVDECEDPNACDSGFLCSNEIGSYSCVCQDGYYMEDGICTDVDECSDPQINTTCDFNLESCVNNIGNYSCECKHGYARNINGSCQDINECEGNSAVCDQLCENFPGGYNCKCYRGYKLAEDRYGCREDKNQCEDQAISCDYGCSIDDSNSAFCICPRGYTLTQDGGCEDINECTSDETNLCTNKAQCVNTNGSFVCSCEPGTKLDNDKSSCINCSGETWGIECANSCACGTGFNYCDPVLGCICKDGFTGEYCNVDIDECERGEHNCQADDGEKCVNIPGSFTCACQSGMTGNFSGSCKDFNPCNDSSLNNCDQVCTSHEGSFTCSCYAGYVYNKTTNMCIDVNECVTGNHQCDGPCINAGGSYRCSCTRGLKLQPDGFSCKADEPCPKKDTCSHGCALIGQEETCLCPRGFALSNDYQTCEDVDLCDNSTCTEGCVEIKANTSFECLCKVGQILASDGITCNDCVEGKWGRDCANDCSCLTFNTKLCNKTTGACDCKDGWEGTNCQIDINECETGQDVCPTNSHCLNLNGTFSCICDDGFVKKNLTTGSCEECDANYYGKLCAQRCSCGPNFDCDKVNGSCYCSKGWKGSNCDIDINECTEGSHNCDPEKFEMCQNIDGGFECVCHMGYYRTRDSDDCQDVDDCNPNPCQNGGTCNDAVDGYNCACVDGYSDKNCTTDMNECDPDPCQNGATCVDEVNDYSCTCVDGYSGKNCSTNIDDCIPDPCLNGATCVDAVNDYSCTCVAGYSGKNCDADINECENEANPPCDQICTNSIGSFECACRTGYMISPQDSTKCQAISVVSVSVTFNYDVSAVDLSDENSQEYQDIKVQAKIVIETRLEQAGISVVSVIVLSLRRGSLIVDYEVIVNTEEEGDPVKVVTMAMVNTIAVGNTNSNPSSVFNSTTAISNVAIGNQQYSANDSACEIKQKSDPCSTICEEKEGVAVCKPEKEKLSINLVLGLGLGIPLFILLCLVIGILTYWWTRKQRKSALSNSRESMSERHRRVGRDMKAGIANPFNFESKYQSSDRQVPSWRKDTMSGSFRSETFPSNLRHYEAMGDYPSYAGSRDKPVNYEEPRPDY